MNEILYKNHELVSTKICEIFLPISFKKPNLKTDSYSLKKQEQIRKTEDEGHQESLNEKETLFLQTEQRS